MVEGDGVRPVKNDIYDDKIKVFVRGYREVYPAFYDDKTRLAIALKGGLVKNPTDSEQLMEVWHRCLRRLSIIETFKNLSVDSKVFKSMPKYNKSGETRLKFKRSFITAYKYLNLSIYTKVNTIKTIGIYIHRLYRLVN